jgi:hypothetical protein
MVSGDPNPEVEGSESFGGYHLLRLIERIHKIHLLVECGSGNVDIHSDGLVDRSDGGIESSPSFEATRHISDLMGKEEFIGSVGLFASFGDIHHHAVARGVVRDDHVESGEERLNVLIALRSSITTKFVR